MFGSSVGCDLEVCFINDMLMYRIGPPEIVKVGKESFVKNIHILIIQCRIEKGKESHDCSILVVKLLCDLKVKTKLIFSLFANALLCFPIFLAKLIA